MLTREERREKHRKAYRLRASRDVAKMEAELTPEQREAYRRHLLACKRFGIPVTELSKLEWLRERI